MQLLSLIFTRVSQVRHIRRYIKELEIRPVLRNFSFILLLISLLLIFLFFNLLFQVFCTATREHPGPVIHRHLGLGFILFDFLLLLLDLWGCLPILLCSFITTFVMATAPASLLVVSTTMSLVTAIATITIFSSIVVSLRISAAPTALIVVFTILTSSASLASIPASTTSAPATVLARLRPLTIVLPIPVLIIISVVAFHLKNKHNKNYGIICT